MNITLDSTILVRAFANTGGPARKLLSTIVNDRHRLLVISTGIAGTAEVICTTDEDFFTAPASEFLKSSNILVCTDLELIGRLCP